MIDQPDFITYSLFVTAIVCLKLEALPSFRNRTRLLGLP